MTDRPLDKNSGNDTLPASAAEGRYRRALRKLLRTSERKQQALWHFQYFELQLIRSQDLNSLLQLLLQQAVDYFNLQGVNLRLFDADASVRDIFTESLGRLPGNIQFASDRDELQALFPGGVKVRAIASAVNGDSEESDSILLPLVRQGLLMGCLQIFVGRKSTVPPVNYSDVLTHFAAVVAICIENCANRERLRLHTLIDALTGVRNRRGFEEALGKEVARAQRTGLSLTALFVDLDHFKSVNDRYGHPCGDRVLIAIAENISEVLRPTDLLSRYGGEEFVALLPACDNRQADGIARRINLSVAALELRGDDGEPFQLTCSVGYSSWLNPGGQGDAAAQQAQSLIVQADKALYRAKQAGRDQACYLPL